MDAKKIDTLVNEIIKKVNELHAYSKELRNNEDNVELANNLSILFITVHMWIACCKDKSMRERYLLAINKISEDYGIVSEDLKDNVIILQ